MHGLEELGLSKNEAKIYQALLRIGLTPITKIAKECGLHRTNVYDATRKLVDKGLVSYIEKDKTAYYEANDPKALVRMVEEKRRLAQALIPQLELDRKLATARGEAHVLEGEQAFINVLYGMLDHGQPIDAYGIPRQAPRRMATRIPHFHDERLKRKIPMRHIYNFDAGERIAQLGAMPRTQARFLPASFNAKVSTTVCGDEVAISIWTKPLITVHIKNQDAADAYKRYFSLLWKAASG